MIFDAFVCNSFQAKIQNDQLCYEVDLNKFSNKSNVEKELKSGFIFIMDYNEDRQVTFDKEGHKIRQFSLTDKIVKSEENQQASIYLNTIGRYRYDVEDN